MQAFPRFCVTLRDKKQTDNISRSGSYNSSKVLSEVCRPCLSHGARPCWSTERASLRVKLRGSLELAGRLRAPAPPPPPCDHKPPREGGPASMGIDFASLSGPRHVHPPWNTGGRMSEDDLVRFFRSDLGDTSRDGGACMPLHPSPPTPTLASRRDRACRDLDLPKKLCRESGFFATRNRGEHSHHTPQAPQPTPHTTAHTTTQEEEGRGGEGGNSFSECCLLQKRPSRGRTSFLFSSPSLAHHPPSVPPPPKEPSTPPLRLRSSEPR